MLAVIVGRNMSDMIALVPSQRQTSSVARTTPLGSLYNLITMCTSQNTSLRPPPADYVTIMAIRRAIELGTLTNDFSSIGQHAHSILGPRVA